MLLVLLLLILMLLNRQTIFESKGDKLFSYAKWRIRILKVRNNESPANWMPMHSQTDWAIDDQAKDVSCGKRTVSRETYCVAYNLTGIWRIKFLTAGLRQLFFLNRWTYQTAVHSMWSLLLKRYQSKCTKPCGFRTNRTWPHPYSPSDAFNLTLTQHTPPYTYTTTALFPLAKNRLKYTGCLLYLHTTPT